MRAVAEGLFCALAAGTKPIVTSFELHNVGFLLGDNGIGHGVTVPENESRDSDMEAVYVRGKGDGGQAPELVSKGTIVPPAMSKRDFNPVNVR